MILCFLFLLPPSLCAVWFDSHPCSSLHGSPEHRPAAAAERRLAWRQQYCEWSESRQRAKSENMSGNITSLNMWLTHMMLCVVFSAGKQHYTWQPEQVRWRWSDVCWGMERWWMHEHGWDFCCQKLFTGEAATFYWEVLIILLLCCAQEDQTPLHIASRLGKTEIVQLLLQHMAHPDAATTNGYTPLHISAREGQVETASVLLEAGASHSLATKVGGGLTYLY